tara:strand:- start:5035 stop:5256 length:222 start_codon:yes stop_codon:yes gene_type:complete
MGMKIKDQYQHMLSYCREHAHQHNECGEINSILLAKACAFHFDMAEWLDDPIHEVWQAAMEAGFEAEINMHGK